MTVTASMVKELREATGAGILASKKALEATDGDFEKAVEHLREMGLAKAAKKTSREAHDGQVTVLIEGSIASLVEVNCETDFVARTDDFKEFVDTIAKQVHQNTELTSLDDLLADNYIKEPGKTVATAIQEAISKLGENIVIRQFIRYEQNGSNVIEGYIHPGGRVGVLVDLGFDGGTVEEGALRELAHDLALQVAATNPRFLNREDVPEETVEKERSILMAQLAEEKKPDNIKAKIVQGKLNKFYKETCLIDQPFVKEDSLSINKLLKQTGNKWGTSLKINQFARFELGSN